MSTAGCTSDTPRTIAIPFRTAGRLLAALLVLMLPHWARAQSANAPQIISATNAGNNAVQVTFSLAVRAAGATNAANYVLTNLDGRVPVLGAAFGGNSLTINLTTASQHPFAPHWLTVSGVADAATGTNFITPGSRVVYTNVPFTSGYIERQLYFNIAGGAVSDLTNSPNFPNHPDQVDFPPAMGWPLPNIGTNYGGRMAGLLIAPFTGTYYFSVESDDNSTLFLSTDESPVHRAVIAAEPAWGGTFDANSSQAVNLTAGSRYYIEALMKQGGGGDYLYVGWKTPQSNSWTIIPDTFLGGYNVATNPVLSVVQQPANLTATENGTATFNALAAGACAFTTNITYQWQSNGFDIPGAISASYATPVLGLTNNGNAYRAMVALPGTARFTSNAILTVTPDVVPPGILQVFNQGPNNVQIVFSEPVTTASAGIPANYVFTNGLGVNAAFLATNLTVVSLTTGPLTYGSNYSIVVNGVRDRAATPNTILTNTVASFTALPYLPQDVGAAATPSTFTSTGSTYGIVSGGYDIGGAADQFAFDYQLRTGDFDVTTRLTGFSAAEVWAKAGLMARETLDPASRFAAVLATPSMNGDFFEYRSPAASVAVSTGMFPANFPDTWLRLQRAGNTFTGFAGYDGTNWTALGSVVIALPAQIYFGFATSSHGQGETAFAQFQNTADTTGAVVAAIAPNPHEAIGPSSRKSPIAFSEIMYKPAPRADGRNLEFIELYNSNPFYQDISGYQVVCDNLAYTVPAGTVLAGGSYLVVAAAPADLQAVYGITNVLGPYAGSLKKTGTLQLIDEHGAQLLVVPYANVSPWPAAADGAGHSLVLANPTYGEGDPQAWDISDVVGGSPGEMEAFRPSPLRNVVINEFLVRPASNQVAYVELYNHSTQPADLSGCSLTDDPTTNKYVFPAGSIIPAAGFLSISLANPGFQPDPAGATLYFENPDQSRVLDAVDFPAQSAGVAMGRSPDGAGQIYRLQGPTPGAANSAILIHDVVLNELMYHPISGNDDDQYVELYNQGTNVISLGGWQLSVAIDFTFPGNAVLFPGGYLVVARNTSRLLFNYPNLNYTNTVGNFTGKLSGHGERLVLSLPDSIIQPNSSGSPKTNAVQIPVDEVTYGTGGRWGQWAAGGGSSLELFDPHSNHRLAANWGDSDETHKSSWTNIEITATLDNGGNYDPYIDYIQVGLLDVGECLVDNLEVHAGTTGPNLVSNPDFESGLTNWYPQGCLFRSSIESEGYSSAQSLHLRCSDRIWTGINSCQGALLTNTMVAGQTATLRFKARWMRGWPEVLMRLNGNWLEATARMPVPANLGTPGARNSRYAANANAGPAIYAVTHAPPVPPASQPVVVTARVHDPDGIQVVVLNYRIDPSPVYAQILMKDDGTGGDAIAGDGIYSATLPARAAGTIVAYFIAARDSVGASTRFPALVSDNAPVHECLIMFGDSNPGGSFGVYHLWINQTNAARWTALSDLSNEAHDCTMVSGNRVIYNAQGRFAGSPYHQTFDTPYGNLCHYKWIFPDDDKFLGATSFNKIHQPGNGAGDDASLQREQLANTFLRALGVPWLNRRFVAVYVNGVRRGPLMEDTQTPDGDVVQEHFPNDNSGFLYKMQPWSEFAPFPTGESIAFTGFSGCTLLPYYITGTQIKKPARYRYDYEIRSTPDSASNFTNVFTLIDAANNSGSVNYVANMQSLADMENWMRVFAANHGAGNWDCFGSGGVQNLYGYSGVLGTRYSLLMWDYNIVFGNGSWLPGQNLFTNDGDPGIIAIYANPAFRRMYWRALQELVNGPLLLSVSGPLLDAKYAAFIANGLTVEDPNTSIKTWLSQAHDSIIPQIAAENTTKFIVSPGVAIVNDTARVSGTAPFGVKTIWLNGVEWPVTWTTVTNWTASIPLQPGSNGIVVLGVDIHGQPVAGASNEVSVTYGGTLPSPVGSVAINEIMYQPAIPNAEFIELYNASTTVAFDLSGWQLNGAGYVFPAGSMIGAGQYLVLAANRAAFAAAFGATIPVFDTFTNVLSAAGEHLALVQPAATGTNGIVIAEVAYGSSLPWPAATNGTASLQLRDPHQANWRAGNWSAGKATPGGINVAYATLPAFPALWINEVEPVNLTGITNSAGQRVPWIEIYNPGTAAVSLGGLYLTPNYTNLTSWAFPAAASINPGQFQIVFADGLTNLTTAGELHTSFSLPGGAGSAALTRLYNGLPQVVDYLDYTNLTDNHSYGSLPDGQSFVRQEFFFVTPGQTNNGASAPLPVAINEWMAANTATIGDPADANKADDWFELFNYSTNTVSLAGYYLTDDLTVPLKFQIPAGYSIPPLGFLLVWADKKSTAGSPTLHVNFKLSKTGASIGLYGPDGNPVDFVTFGPQASDISQGRYPDGGTGLAFMTSATPGTNNVVPNSPPALAALPDRVATLGQTVSFTASATDPDFPPQILTFSLGAGAPAGAVINPVTGQFSWTPGAAPATNTINVEVTDNGTPNLSAGQSFTVRVFPPPQLSQASVANGQLVIAWTTAPSQMYQVEYKHDLEDTIWLPLGAPVTGAGGILATTNSLPALSQSFFRVRLAP